MKAPLFYSKILLFGEYGIIKNSKGLSIPYNFFKGGFKLGDLNNQEVKKSNNNLRLFKDFISKLDNTIVAFDLNKMDNDLNMGMYFDSTIPQGYGVGSSGALVAAIYDRYAQNKITVLENLTKEKILVLKHVFSEMESYFHGKSSGLDPLNSYLSLPILMHSKNKVETTWIPSQFYNGKGAVFLLDSGESSNTAPMVEIFFESMKNKEYSKIIKEDFINTTDNCVDDFLKADFKSLFL
ncbi:MAG: mevalonate kinase, partial [Flavobacteriaceae bacterium]|nr:mevalonate kinase [Flavobacteriaceae bacterium]